ncbi:MAG TPA: DNA/RNA non-specific endonuclease [Candidatus Bacteroides avicola]|uniref:DNA/RNA non-specific endonuclease n=1 Tax=Candidatus Bacteroides avicola TaxID=2838468 RepID=A0A9D2HX28_9BACE|nr:DNA/RNA non-specific endonuclease [Candidatus Bacteroides avicola]
MTPLKSLLLSLCLLTLLAACGGDEPTETLPPVTPPDEEEPIIPPGDDEDNANANEADEAHPFATDLSIPHLDAENQYVEHIVSFREQEILNYALEWVEDKRHAAWVAFSFDSETCQKNVNRTNTWMPDPFISSSPQESDHKSDGFDKGHLCASEDRVYNRTANEQTFYYTNISPQMTSFNGGYWVTFEKLLQTWARSGAYEHVYVTKGGTLNHLLTNFTGTQKAADGRLPQTDADGLTNHGLACPAYYFMAILAKQGENYQAIGFLVEHRDDYGYSNDHQAPVELIQAHAINIDELEVQTGLDFFCNLPDKTEAQVEATYEESAWEWKVTE